jgi:hypothetical protein
MENQGRRPDQIEYAEKAVFYSTLGIIIVLLLSLVF